MPPMQRTVMDDRYTLVELLGSGGMAQVYLAHDEVLDRNVALKVLREQYVEDEEFVERFRREARSAAGLSHPNIVPVYDQGRSESGAYYMAMEYVPRGTLKDRIRRAGALAPASAAGVALQIAEALEAAHEKGVIHRDIKPQNVLVTSTGDVKVTDFGIARAASSPATATGVVLGTAGYMSPEQAKGELVGPRSDLYSLGVVLYEMLTGNLPYEAESDIALAMKHINEPPYSPREANPEVPKGLDALTMKLLAKDPEDRYASATALVNDLERIGAGASLTIATGPKKTGVMTAPHLPNRRRKTVTRSPAAPTGASGRGRRRGRLLPVLATLLLSVAVLGGLAWGLTQGFDGLETEGSEDRSGVEVSNVRVPDLYYASTAAADLAAVGLKLGRRDEVTNGVIPAGVVIESDPAEGIEARPGTAVNIVVSTGPQQQVPIQIPSVPQAAPEVPTPDAPPQPAQQPSGAVPGGGGGKSDGDEGGKGKEEQGNAKTSRNDASDRREPTPKPQEAIVVAPTPITGTPATFEQASPRGVNAPRAPER